MFQGSTPSGTLLNTAGKYHRYGTFYVYWGEDDQPINTLLANSTTDAKGNYKFVGVSSRWPWSGGEAGPSAVGGGTSLDDFARAVSA